MRRTHYQMWIMQKTLIFSLLIFGVIWILAWMSRCHGATSSFWKVFAIFMLPKPLSFAPLLRVSLPETTCLFPVCFNPLPDGNKTELMKGSLCSHPYPLKTRFESSCAPKLAVESGWKVDIADIIEWFKIITDMHCKICMNALISR